MMLPRFVFFITVNPLLSNGSVLDQKIRDFYVSDCEHETTKPSEQKRAMLLHPSAFEFKVRSEQTCSLLPD